MKNIKIITADINSLDLLVPLFDQYRVFYKMASDIEAAKIFLSERITKEESIVYIAVQDGGAIGFTQLYPSFSSVSMQHSYILNDLYVSDQARNKGIASMLLTHAQDLCKRQGYKGLALETAMDNPAQHLYEKLGWTKDTEHFHYFWS